MRTKYIFMAFIAMLASFCYPVRALSSDNNAEQISTIIAFFEIMENNKPPTVADFFYLFGKDNEAEVDLILQQRFSARKSNQFGTQEEIKYTKDVYENPDKYQSLFLEIVKETNKEIFTTRTTRMLEFPPTTTEDFTKYNVISCGKRVIFIFSQNDRTLEDVMLPDGNSIYSIISRDENRK